MHRLKWPCFIGLLTTFVMLMPFQHHVDAQTQEDILLTGHGWMALTEFEKNAYFMGVYDFINFIYDWEYAINPGSDDEITKEETRRVLHVLTALQIQATNEEVFYYIDEFYQDDVNLSIPTMYVYNLFVQKYNEQLGSDEEAEIIANLREIYKYPNVFK